MAFLNFKEILELIDRVADREIGLVEIESSGLRIRVEGKRSEPAAVMPASVGATTVTAPAVASPAPKPAAAAPPVEPEEDLHEITSPIVGTFYRSPSPDSDSFVNVGDRVSKGAVLCIIEAMKLMNEIESDAEGIVAKIYPQNGQPIEYGEKLFALKPL